MGTGWTDTTTTAGGGSPTITGTAVYTVIRDTAIVRLRLRGYSGTSITGEIFHHMVVGIESTARDQGVGGTGIGEESLRRITTPSAQGTTRHIARNQVTYDMAVGTTNQVGSINNLVTVIVERGGGKGYPRGMGVK